VNAMTQHTATDAGISPYMAAKRAKCATLPSPTSAYAMGVRLRDLDAEFVLLDHERVETTNNKVRAARDKRMNKIAREQRSLEQAVFKSNPKTMPDAVAMQMVALSYLGCLAEGSVPVGATMEERLTQIYSVSVRALQFMATVYGVNLDSIGGDYYLGNRNRLFEITDPVVHADASHPDAGLLKACAEFHQLLAEEKSLIPLLDGDVQDKAVEAAHDYWDSDLMVRVDELVDLIRDLHARTAEGMRAKCSVATVWLNRKVCCGVGDTFDSVAEFPERLYMSALQDVAATPTFFPVDPKGDDADLTRICAEHVVNIDAYNRSGGNGPDLAVDPLWLAYERTRNAIRDAKPRTLEGMLAKARAAKAEARQLDGTEDPNGTPAEGWAWDLVNDLLAGAAQ
jgi:hypothetical protein